MRKINCLCVLAVILLIFFSGMEPVSAAENRPLPSNGGYTNVKSFGAMGDGVTDDTLAIQTAMNNKTGEIIYFPKGTYLVSDRMYWPGKATRIIWQGENRDEVIIKLKDNCPGYIDPSTPKEIIWTGEAPAQRFRNGLRNLTIDTGIGNDGAIGAKFMANNQGGIEDVTIRSGDGKGIYGLDLGYSDENGPCLIKSVHIIGFDVGIRCKYGVDSQTFEDIKLENQNQYGMTNDGQILSIRKLNSINSVPALYNKRGSSLVTLIDSELSGGAVSNPAIINEAATFIRNLKTSGYSMALQNDGGTYESIQDKDISEFASHPILSKFTSPAHSLNLPIKETPQIPWGDLSNWVSITDYAPEQVTAVDINGNTVSVLDYTKSFQQAIDSGKSTVYFPSHGITVAGSVYLRGNVHRIIGLDHELNRNFIPNFILDEGTAPAVIIDGFDSMYSKIDVTQQSSRSLVMKKFMAHHVIAQANTGDVFIEDCVVDWLVLEKGSNIWARQLNLERKEGLMKCNNNGGNLWILGLKGESQSSYVDARDGAKVEVLGGFIYANKANLGQITFLSTDSSISFTTGEMVIRNSPQSPIVETRDGVVQQMYPGEAPGRGGGSLVTLFVGYKGTGTVPPISPSQLTAQAVNTSRVNLSWSKSPDADSYELLRSEDGINFTRINLIDKSKNTYQDNNLMASRNYTYKLKAYNNAGYAPEVAVTVKTLDAANVGVGTGLRGEYYDTEYFTDSKVTRIDPVVDFTWEAGTAPDISMGVDKYSVRWTGQIESRYSDEYTFYTDTDEGVRLFINGKLLINDWATGAKSKNAKIILQAGIKYNIKLEMFNPSGAGKAVLTWSSKNQPKETVPTSQLYPAVTAQVEYNLTAVEADAGEPSKDAKLTLTRTGDISKDAILEYTVTGNASPALDYQRLPGIITIPAGSNTVTIPIKVVDDDRGEIEESITVRLLPQASYNWAGLATIKFTDNDMPAAGDGTGLRGEYFNTTGFTESVGVRLDSTVNFTWTLSKPPHPALTADHKFTIRWTGQILPLFSDTYTFTTDCGEGGQLWIDGQQIINWSSSGRSGKITLEAGKKYDIIMEAKDDSYEASYAKLYWDSYKQYRQIVPKTQLFPAPIDGDVEAPSAPSNLALASKSDTTVSLTWSTSTDNIGVTGYEIFRGSTKINTVTGAVYAYTDTGLAPGTAYTYLVKARDEVGNISNSSNTLAVTTDAQLDTTNPNPPEELISTARTETTISLSWKVALDNVGVSGYEIYRGNTKVGTTANTTFTDTGLTAGTAYTYTIKAKDAAGNVSFPSNTITVVTVLGSTGNYTWKNILEDSFDNGTIGSAPIDWTITSSASTSCVVAEVPDTTDKSMKLFDNNKSYSMSVVRSFEPQSNQITMEFKYRTDAVNKYQGAALLSGNTVAVDLVDTRYNGYCYRNASGTEVKVDTFSSNTWYTIKVVANIGTNKFDIYVNNVLKKSGCQFRNPATMIDGIKFSSGSSDISTQYINDVKVMTLEKVEETKSNNVSLSGIQLNGQNLTGFEISKLDYEVEQEYQVASIPQVTAAAQDSKAAVLVEQATILPGTAIIQITAEDGITASTYKINFVMTDRIAPVTVANLSGTQVNNWYNTDVTVNLSAADGYSGVGLTRFSMNSGETWNNYTDSIKLTAEGKNTVMYYSVDVAGNKEEALILTVSIDKSAPVTVPVVEGVKGANEWYVSGVTVKLNATDICSGVAETRYKLTVLQSVYQESGTDKRYETPIILKDGKYLIEYYSVDTAGIIEEKKNINLAVDTEAPKASVSINGEDLKNGKIIYDSETIKLSLSLFDNLSGVVQGSIIVDGTPYIANTELDFAGKLGIHNITIDLIDGAGNKTHNTYSLEVRTSIEAIAKLITKYAASNDLTGSAIIQLRASLEQAKSHYEKGNTSQAVKHMEDFIKHLLKNAQSKSNNKSVSDKALAVLQADAQDVIDLWKNK